MPKQIAYSQAEWERQTWDRGSPSHRRGMKGAAQGDHTGPRCIFQLSPLQLEAFSLSVKWASACTIAWFSLISQLNGNLRTVYNSTGSRDNWMGGKWPTSSNSQAAWSTTSFSDHTWLRGPIFLDEEGCIYTVSNTTKQTYTCIYCKNIPGNKK